VVRRGHFRIVAWGAFLVGALALLSGRAALDGVSGAGTFENALIALVIACLLYALVQYSRSDVAGAVLGLAVTVVGAGSLALAAGLLAPGPDVLEGFQLLAGAAVLGAVTNGMLLGHWYLNQPGLQPWALARLTTLSLVAVLGSGALGLLAAGSLAGASTGGAVLGLPGFGESLGVAFYLVWLMLVILTGVVILLARRCVKIRSIQSATGLYYVAILTAGVAEFVVRYLMVNA
jgi:hypothetical protein